MGHQESSFLDNKNPSIDHLLDNWLCLKTGMLDGAVIVLPVLSGSMAPVLMPGYKIRIQRSSCCECDLGDIIVFRLRRMFLAHRLLLNIRIFRNCWLFQKGDNNKFGHIIRGKQLIGVVSEAWDESGRKVYQRTESSGARAIAQRQLWHDFLARMLYFPRLFKRLLWRIIGL